MQNETFSDSVSPQLASIIEKIGKLEGGQSALERQVSGIDRSTNDRLLRLETKVDDGFAKITAMIENIYSSINRHSGIADTLDYGVRAILPVLLGAIGTAAAYHFGWWK